MKRVTVLLTILILTAVLAGCSAIPWSLNAKTITPSDNIITENRDVSGFTGVNMETIGKVILSQGESESLVIEGPENLIPLVKTSVRNGVLVIEIPEKVNIRSGGSGNLLTFSITLIDLTDLTVSGIGTVEMDALNTDSLKLLMSGAGAVSLDQLSVANADINMSGLGKVTLAGSATSATLDISGAGEVDAGNLQCQTVDVQISGLGGATVWVTDTLTGKISGSGGVRYYGNPQVNTKTTGLGKFESLGDK